MADEKEEYKKEIIMTEPYDGHLMTPEKDCGIGSMSFIFVLTGKKGAISTRISTLIFLPKTVERYLNGDAIGPFGRIPKTDLRCGYSTDYEPFGNHGIFKHAPSLDGESCEFFKSGLYKCEECRSLSYDKIARSLVREGSDGVWRHLETIYKEEFDEIKED